MPSLRELRAARLWSIRDLAERAGVSTATIVAIEHGKARLRFVTMRKIAGALETEPAEITEFAQVIRLMAKGQADA